MVTETMASFGEERTTIAADSSDSSDAKNTNNNGGIEHNANLHELNGENNNVRGLINDNCEMACSDAFTKMDKNQLNTVSTTTSEIDEVKNGTSSSSSIEDNANAENNSMVTRNESVQLPLATENVVNHVESVDAPVVSSVKHVSSSKSKSNSSADTKTGERSHHSSKSQSTNCGKFVPLSSI